jgi:hypothetical protein
MNRDERVSQIELQLLIDDLRRLRQRMAEELERCGVGPEMSDQVLNETDPVP